MPQNQKLVAAFVGTGGNKLNTTSSTNGGQTWSAISPVGFNSSTGPELCEDSTNLHMAFAASDGSGLKFIRLNDGNWTEGATPQAQSKLAPALGYIGRSRKFVMVYVDAGSGRLFAITLAYGGSHWSTATAIATKTTISVAPCIASYEGRLFLVYVDSADNLHICNSYDGDTWQSPYLVGSQTTKHRPALAALGDKLVLVHVKADGSNELIATATSDEGETWTPGQTIPSEECLTAPTMSPMSGGVALVYGGANNQLRAITSTTGTAWLPSNSYYSMDGHVSELPAGLGIAPAS